LPQATESWTLKVDCNGEICRLRGWPDSGVEPTLETLLAAAGKLFRVEPAEFGSLRLLVRDGDGNMERLTEDLLSKLLASEDTGSGRLLRLTLVVACPEPVEFDISSAAGTEGNAISTETNAASLSGEDVAGNAELRSLLTNRLKNFGHQVANDFRSASDDAVQAFCPSAQGNATQGAGDAAKKAALVPAALVGVCVATRRAPLRLVKTAAHTYAVAKGRSTLEEAELAEEEQQETAQDEIPQSSQSPHVRDHLHHNLTHFRKQVTEDFKVAKEDVKATYNFVVGHQECASTDQVAQEQDGEQRPMQQQQQQQLIAKLPCVASTAVGAFVAGTLIPVRALRLAAASTSAVIASTGTRNAVAGGQGVDNAR